MQNELGVSNIEFELKTKERNAFVFCHFKDLSTAYILEIDYLVSKGF